MHPCSLAQVGKESFEMSFDLAFWRSSDGDGVPSELYEQMMDEAVDVVAEAPEQLAALVADITARYPEITGENMEESPWASEFDLTDEYLVVAISGSRSAEVAPFLVPLAHKHGLVVYDPQNDELIS
jgi:hypothetical protein